MMISYSSTATTESQPPRDGEVRMSVCNRDEPDLKFSFSFSFVRAKPLFILPRVSSPPKVSYPTYCAMPTVVELKAELRELGLPTYGLKAELQSRLRAHYCDDRNANASNNDGEEANNDDDDNSRPRPQDHPSCNGGGSGTATVGGRASLTNRASATKEETKVMINGSGSSSSKNNNANGSSSAPSDNANDESSSSSVSSSVMKKRRNQSNYTTMIGIVLLAILIANVVPVLDVDLLPESIQGRLLPLLQRYRDYYDSDNTPPRHATTTAATTTTTLIGDNRDTSTPIMSYETDVTNDEKLNLNTDDTDIGGGDEDVVMNDGVSEESVIVAANNDDDASTPPVVIDDTPPPPPPPRINAHRAGRMGDVAALTAIGATDIGLLNIRDANGWTPLHEAARGGHLEAVKFLIDIGLDKVKKKIQGTNHSVSFLIFFFI